MSLLIRQIAYSRTLLKVWIPRMETEVFLPESGQGCCEISGFHYLSKVIVVMTTFELLEQFLEPFEAVI